MHVAIDNSRCEGHGRCYAIAPTIFASDEQGRGVVIAGGIAANDLELARLAIANWPESAIDAHDGPGA